MWLATEIRAIPINGSRYKAQIIDTKHRKMPISKSFDPLLRYNLHFNLAFLRSISYKRIERVTYRILSRYPPSLPLFVSLSFLPLVPSLTS